MTSTAPDHTARIRWTRVLVAVCAGAGLAKFVISELVAAGPFSDMRVLDSVALVGAAVLGFTLRDARRDRPTDISHLVAGAAEAVATAFGTVGLFLFIAALDNMAVLASTYPQ